MGTAERKARERAEREALILDEARKMVARDGYLGLNMDRLAERISYSKGTIYQHFSAKEDLMLGVVTEGKRARAQLFEKALRLSGRPRERMAAIGVADELFVRLHPEHFQVEHLVRLESLWDKTSEERRQELEEVSYLCNEYCSRILHEAIETGDLDVAPDQAKELFFLLMTASLGTHLVAHDRHFLDVLGVADPYLAQRNNYDMYLDGWDWRPLSADWDYEKTYERIEQDLFVEEFARLERPKSAASNRGETKEAP